MAWARKSLDDLKPYRPGKRVSEVRQELGLDEIIKLSSNESPLPPLRSARRAMAKAAKGLNRYPDGACHLLRDRLSHRLNTAYERIVIGNGSNELIRLLAQVVLEPGDEIVIGEPSFIVYPLVAKIMGAETTRVALKDLTHDLEAMSAAVTKKTKLIFVCNPNNPTGTIVSAKTAGSFMASIPKDVLVCFDEAYHEYVVDPAYRTALEMTADHQNVVVLRTFSKIYGLAGTRIGYGVMPPEIVEAIDKVREPFNVNTLGQVGAFWSLEDEMEITKRRLYTQRQKEKVHAALDRLGFDYADSQTNFVYLDSKKPAMEAFDELKRQGVIVRAFPGSNYIRVTLGTSSENNKLIEALAAL